jgi:hypothetical protein
MHNVVHQNQSLDVRRQHVIFHVGVDVVPGTRRAADIYTLIETAKLNDTAPQTWLTDVLARLQDHPARRIAELLPWNWKLQLPQRAAA